MSHSLCKMEGTANVTLSLQHKGGRLKVLLYSLYKRRGTANVTLSLQNGRNGECFTFFAT